MIEEIPWLGIFVAMWFVAFAIIALYEESISTFIKDKALRFAINIAQKKAKEIMNSNARRRQIFIVTIDVPEHLERKVVSNYVDLAIKKYDKLSAKGNHGAKYFEGWGVEPKFTVNEVQTILDAGGKPVKEDVIRESVWLIGEVKKATDEAFQDIDTSYWGR